jgi:hypothetical protein
MSFEFTAYRLKYNSALLATINEKLVSKTIGFQKMKWTRLTLPRARFRR